MAIGTDWREMWLEQALDKMKEIARHLEKMRFEEYAELLQNPWRLVYLNFIAGIARGLGIALGITILSALVLILLQQVVMWNLPVIGGFLAQLVNMVQSQLPRRS